MSAGPAGRRRRGRGEDGDHAVDGGFQQFIALVTSRRGIFGGLLDRLVRDEVAKQSAEVCDAHRLTRELADALEHRPVTLWLRGWDHWWRNGEPGMRPGRRGVCRL